MHDMRTIAIDNPVAWAYVTLTVSLSVCHDYFYSFTRWRYFDAANYCIIYIAVATYYIKTLCVIIMLDV